MIKLKKLLLELWDRDNSDEYYYHITLAPYIPRIKSDGLRVNRKSTVHNYREYSKGKLFFCDIGNLDWWIDKIGEHAFHHFDDEKYHNLAVFRVLKTNVKSVEGDMIGTHDSRSKTYFTREDIPPQYVEFVKFVPNPY